MLPVQSPQSILKNRTKRLVLFAIQSVSEVEACSGAWRIERTQPMNGIGGPTVRPVEHACRLGYDWRQQEQVRLVRGASSRYTPLHFPRGSAPIGNLPIDTFATRNAFAELSLARETHFLGPIHLDHQVHHFLLRTAQPTDNDRSIAQTSTLEIDSKLATEHHHIQWILSLL